MRSMILRHIGALLMGGRRNGCSFYLDDYSADRFGVVFNLAPFRVSRNDIRSKSA